MNTSTFSQTVLESFSDNVTAVKTQYSESLKAAEAARKAVKALTTKMRNIEVNLKKKDKDQVRSGPKNLNKGTFDEIVFSYLSNCQGEKHIDDVVKSAISRGVVSLSKRGLRDSIERSLYRLANTKGSGIKANGNGFYQYR